MVCGSRPQPGQFPHQRHPQRQRREQLCRRGRRAGGGRQHRQICLAGTPQLLPRYFSDAALLPRQSGVLCRHLGFGKQLRRDWPVYHRQLAAGRGAHFAGQPGLARTARARLCQRNAAFL